MVGRASGFAAADMKNVLSLEGRIETEEALC